MLATRYLSVGLDFLFRREVERRLYSLANKFRKQTQLFDCSEFGLCLLRWVEYKGWSPEWFMPADHRKRKPRIAVTVVLTDTATRRRWQFAMSRLGFLYPVSYVRESKHIGKTVQWEVEAKYETWRGERYAIWQSKDQEEMIPDDTVCREAEYLLAGKKRPKRSRR